MTAGHPIHDLFIRPLESEARGPGRAIPLLRYSDHLLRRFGLAEVHHLPANDTFPLEARPVADELWALISGRVRFDWYDQRADSPTGGAHHQLDCDRPTLVLVPFGVAFAISALDGPAELVRIATHEDDAQHG